MQARTDPSMTPEKWQWMKTLYALADELPSDQWFSFLDEVCKDAPDVRDQVLDLLRARHASNRLDDLARDVMEPLLSADVDEHPPVERIGSYELMEEIGRGGMGVVYRALDTNLKRVVALKVLPLHLLSRQNARTRFLIEARAAGLHDHPNICTVYQAGETDDGRLFIAMPCYEGRTLKQRLAEGILPVDESVELAHQIAEGLAHAHRAGVIHRDIKPANLFLLDQGIVKILDFGIAKLEGARDLTGAGVRLGTIAYMSPEQVRGERVDHRTDIWSLGVVLYEMLSGISPFGVTIASELVQAILHRDPAPPSHHRPEITPQLDAIVAKALAKEPDQRYQHASDLASDLKAVLDAGQMPRITGELPVFLTSFVGRERELDEIAGLLSRVRLLTLTGPGGAGKTRLSVEAVSRYARDFRDGVVYVSLAAVSDPGAVASAIGHKLNLKDTPTRSALENLKRYLAPKFMLLVLDNFEHVLAAAPVVFELLKACPGLKVLTTSRIPLGVRGEQEYPVTPLEVPHFLSTSVFDSLESCASVALFVERARAVQPNFTITQTSAPAVARLCTRLDGLPLAIELAAARIKIFTPEDMLVRLDRRLDILKSPVPDLPSRHQTLRNLIGWSYDLLDENQKKSFRRLAVFPGSFTLEAAEVILNSPDVLTEPVEAVAALVNQSLLVRDDTEEGPRFRMLDTIRTFALENLYTSGEAEEAFRMHTRYYLDMVERASPALVTLEQTTWTERLEAELDNIRAALRWSEENMDAETGLRLCGALWRFWVIRGYLKEGYHWLERMINLPREGVSAGVYARALNGIGTLAHLTGDNFQARDYLEKSLDIWKKWQNNKELALVLNNLGWVACELSDFQLGRTYSLEALEISTSESEKRAIAVALNNLGWIENYRGRYRTAHAYHKESLKYRREIGDRRGEAFALINLAWAEVNHGDYLQATELLNSAGVILASINDPVIGGWGMSVRCMAEMAQGVSDKSRRLVEELFGLSSMIELRSGRGWTLWMYGTSMLDDGNIDQAEQFITEASAIFSAIGFKWGTALTQFAFSRIEQAKGNWQEAEIRYRANLAEWHELGCELGCATCLESLVDVEIHNGRLEHGAKIAAAASIIRVEIEAPVPPRQYARHERRIETLQSALGDKRFEKIWEDGKSLHLADLVREISG